MARHRKPDSLRVCIITNEIIGPFRNGGMGTANTGLVEYMVSVSHDVTILYTAGDADVARAAISIKDWQQIYRQIGARLLLLPEVDCIELVDRWSDARLLSLRTYNFVKSERFDIVFFNDCEALGYHSIVAKSLGVALPHATLVVVTHGAHAWLREANKAIYDNNHELQRAWMERRCVELADHVISPSAYMIDWMRNAGWKLPASAQVIPNLMPSREFGRLLSDSKTGDASTIKSDLNVSAKINELVFFGRIELRKGINLFLDAIDILVRDLPSSDFPSITFLGKFSKLLGLHSGGEVLKRCEFWPGSVRINSQLSQPEALAYLRHRGRLAVIPSLLENSPCTVLECLQEGLPFIASAVGGIPELIDEEDHERLLFQPAARGLADKFGAILRDGALPGRPRYSREAISDRWDYWYDSLVGARRESIAAPPVYDLRGVAMAHPSRSWKGKARGSLYQPVPWAVPSTTMPSPAPSVTVVVAHHNRPRLLARALASLHSQTYRNVEIVVVDDGSTLPEAIEYLEELETSDGNGRVRVLRQENKYLGAARNAGARLSNAEYLFFMDDDNVALPWEIQTLVSAAEHAGLDVVNCLALAFDEKETPSPETGRIQYPPIGQDLPAALLGNVFGDANCLFRRRAFEALGGFSEAYGLATSDYLLFFRATIQGYRQEVIPEPLFYYQLSTSGMYNNSHPVNDILPIYDAAMEIPVKRIGDLLDLFIGPNSLTIHQDYLKGLLSRRPNGEMWKLLSAQEPNSNVALQILDRLAGSLKRSDGPVDLCLTSSSAAETGALEFSDWASADALGMTERGLELIGQMHHGAAGRRMPKTGFQALRRVAGHVCFGPYIRLPVGRYRVEFAIAIPLLRGFRRGRNIGSVDVVSVDAGWQGAVRSFTAAERAMSVSFEVREAAAGKPVEFRVSSLGVAIFSISSIRLTRDAHIHSVEQAHSEIDKTLEHLRVLLQERARLTHEPYLPWPATPPQEHLRNSRVITDRDQMLTFLPKGGVVAEVGTYQGYFAKRILVSTEPERLEVIDVDFSVFPFDEFDSEIKSGRVVIHQGRSAEVLQTFEAEYFDWIYVDADHSYQGVKADIEAAIPTLKQGGLLVFNDYTPWSPIDMSQYGVVQAVNELCLTGWEIVFFALHGMGYHDVALRRMECSDTMRAQSVDRSSKTIAGVRGEEHADDGGP